MEQTRLQQVLQKSLFMQGGKKIKLGDVFAELRESPGDGFSVPSPFLPLSRWFYCDHSDNSQQSGLRGFGVQFQSQQWDTSAFQGTGHRQCSIGKEPPRADPAGMGQWGLPWARSCSGTAPGMLLTAMGQPWDTL